MRWEKLDRCKKCGAFKQGIWHWGTARRECLKEING